MPPEPSGVSLSTLRAAVTRRIEQTTLRRVAEEIGMSPSGLWSFVQSEGRPYGATYQKVIAWYVREQSQLDSASAASIQAALSILVAHLPRQTHDQVKREIIELVAKDLPPRKRARWLHMLSDKDKNRLTSKRES